MRTPRLPPLGALRAFHAVARQRSFKLAAGALGVSATAVSHQIKLLESVLECRVCERSAQGVSLTADGEILYAATQRAFSALEQAVVQIAQARQPPSLTVTTTSNFLTHWLVPRLADFTARFPAIDLRLHTSVERVDLHLGTVDAAIRYRETPEPDLCCTLLHEDRFIVVASPTLALSRPDDLAQVTLFHVANRHVPADSPSWENWRRRYGPPTLNIDAGLTFSDETHALQAAVAGQGAVIASELLARDLLQRGVLSAPFSSAECYPRHSAARYRAPATTWSPPRRQRSGGILSRCGSGWWGRWPRATASSRQRDSGLTSRKRWSLRRTHSRGRY